VFGTPLDRSEMSLDGTTDELKSLFVPKKDTGLMKKNSLLSKFKDNLKSKLNAMLLTPKDEAHLTHQICLAFRTPLEQQDLNGEWVSPTKFALIMGGKLKFVSLNSAHLEVLGSKCSFGTQEISPGNFCTLIKQDSSSPHFLVLLQALFRMEIASLRKFSFIREFRSLEDDQLRLLFFNPTEELRGANVFSKLSNHFGVLQPFLEVVDSQFIKLMNSDIDSVFNRLNSRLGVESSEAPDEVFSNCQVHMYQQDLEGLSAIDYAFRKNAIFCIKAFVETLLLLPDTHQFSNCFNKALLLMINKGMNVKQLV